MRKVFLMMSISFLCINACNAGELLLALGDPVSHSFRKEVRPNDIIIKTSEVPLAKQINSDPQNSTVESTLEVYNKQVLCHEPACALVTGLGYGALAYYSFASDPGVALKLAITATTSVLVHTKPINGLYVASLLSEVFTYGSIMRNSSDCITAALIPAILVVFSVFPNIFSDDVIKKFINNEHSDDLKMQKTNLASTVWCWKSIPYLMSRVLMMGCLWYMLSQSLVHNH